MINDREKRCVLRRFRKTVSVGADMYEALKQTQNKTILFCFWICFALFCFSCKSRFTCQVSSECVHCVGFRWPKTSILGKFWHLGNSDTVEHRCTTANLPLSNGIKIVSVLQRRHGKIVHTNSDVQKRDGRTDRQTRNLSIAEPLQNRQHALNP